MVPTGHRLCTLSQMTDKRFTGPAIRTTLSRGNRAEVAVVFRSSGAVVEKRLLDFANVSTERTALYYEALLQKAASGPGVVPVVDARLSHVTALHEVGEAPDELESFERFYVQGYSLRELAGEPMRHHLTLDRCLLWMARLTQVLHRVHGLLSLGGETLGVVHRDVTWDNILIFESELRESGSGEGVFLNDFGLAHVTAWGALPLEDTLQGAPRFLSPELKAGGQPQAASDVYQAALTLCLLLNAKEDNSPKALFETDFSNPISDRARALLQPFGAESALSLDPGSRPTALELSALLSR